MSRQAALFAPPPRQPPRKLMHVCDAGPGEYGDLVRFHCDRCGYESEWTKMGLAASKRGVPCPTCQPAL